MTDIQLLALLNKYFAAQRDMATYILWAMEDLERNREAYSWFYLFAWCEAKDERESLWKKFKHDYPRAMMLKEGVSYV